LEACLARVDSYRCRGQIDGLEKLRLRAASDIMSGSNIGRIVLALVRTSSRVRTSIAAHVTLSSGAVNQVLFREGDETASSKEVSAFSRASRRERPAASTLLLVLDLYIDNRHIQ
jgi:hypothetical protein